VTTALQLYLPCDLRIAWPGGTELFYNLRFSRSNAKRRSYSHPLRPDTRHPASSPSSTPSSACTVPTSPPTPKTPTKLTSPTNGAASSNTPTSTRCTPTATPRSPRRLDPLPRNSFRFFDAQGSGTSITDPSTFRHPIEGVGAIPLAPDEPKLDDLQRVLEHLLDR
jgi:hypothetical protein